MFGDNWPPEKVPLDHRSSRLYLYLWCFDLFHSRLSWKRFNWLMMSLGSLDVFLLHEMGDELPDGRVVMVAGMKALVRRCKWVRQVHQDIDGRVEDKEVVAVVVFGAAFGLAVGEPLVGHDLHDPVEVDPLPGLEQLRVGHPDPGLDEAEEIGRPVDEARSRSPAGQDGGRQSGEEGPEDLLGGACALLHLKVRPGEGDVGGARRARKELPELERGVVRVALQVRLGRGRPPEVGGAEPAEGGIDLGHGGVIEELCLEEGLVAALEEAVLLGRQVLDQLLGSQCIGGGWLVEDGLEEGEAGAPDVLQPRRLDAAQELARPDDLLARGGEELEGVQAGAQVALHGLGQVRQVPPVDLEGLELADLAEALRQVQRARLLQRDHLGRQPKGLQRRHVSKCEVNCM